MCSSNSKQAYTSGQVLTHLDSSIPPKKNKKNSSSTVVGLVGLLAGQEYQSCQGLQVEPSPTIQLVDNQHCERMCPHQPSRPLAQETCMLNHVKNAMINNIYCRSDRMSSPLDDEDGASVLPSSSAILASYQIQSS